NSRDNNFLANCFPQNNNNQPRNLPNHKNAKDAKGKGKKRPCYVCGRTNHIARDCFHKKVEEYKPNGRNQGDQVNMLLDDEPPISLNPEYHKYFTSFQLAEVGRTASVRQVYAMAKLAY
ncbi:hypothetical protein RJ640_000444, partial [Escallonia rubra]